MALIMELKSFVGPTNPHEQFTTLKKCHGKFECLIYEILKKTTTLLNLQNMFRQKLLSSSVDRFTKR